MAISNVALSDTFDIWRTRTNQLVIISNDLVDNDFNKLTGNVRFRNVTMNPDERTEVLNVSNGYISANGAGLRYLKNTSITGVILNSQLQNSRITLISNSTSLSITGGGANLGNTVYLNISVSDRLNDTSTTNVATANSVKAIYDYTVSASINNQSYATSVGLVSNNYATFVGAAGNTYASSVGAGANTYSLSAYNRANTALSLAQSAFARANLNNVTISSASPTGGIDGDIWFQV